MKVVFVGLGGIPSGKRAIDVRIDALAKLTARVGYNVEVINRFSKTMVGHQSSYGIYDPYAKEKRESWGRIKFFFYYVTIIGYDSRHDIGYLFCSIPIFLGMAVFNEIIGLSVLKGDDNDNNENNNFKTSLIDQSSNNNINNNNVLNNNINNDINTNNYNAPNVNSMPNVNDAPNFNNNNNNIIVDNSNNNMQETDRTEN